MSLLADRDSVATIPENDGLGAVTQLIVRYLTGQVGAYFEFYEFMKDRLLVGVPDFIPAEVAQGKVRARLSRFGLLSAGVLNISRVRTGRVTLCRLASRGDRYRMHIVTGEAVPPAGKRLGTSRAATSGTGGYSTVLLQISPRRCCLNTTLLRTATTATSWKISAGCWGLRSSRYRE